MAPLPRADNPPQIGSILKEARTRRGLDIRTVEERTKIRTKYLRALENEDWDALPGPAYARGFLRTYASLLGLDAEALVDELRRRAEQEEGHPYALAEPVLREHHPPGSGGGGLDRRILVAALVGGLAILLLVLGLTAGSDDEEGKGRRAAKQERKGDRGKQQSEGQAAPDTVTVRLVARSPTEVCLVSRGGDVLLDNQLLATGDEEGEFEADEFALSLGPGVLQLTANGDSRRIAAQGPVAYELTPRNIREVGPDPDPECP